MGMVTEGRDGVRGVGPYTVDYGGPEIRDIITMIIGERRTREWR